MALDEEETEAGNRHPGRGQVVEEKERTRAGVDRENSRR